ncbi:MAG: nuclear transport factor 2 family protein [Deltaproteobacteria bacterium]|nr:nuclear transport factor 2 family protein [Deltaproteobacteria bacterium]
MNTLCFRMIMLLAFGCICSGCASNSDTAQVSMDRYAEALHQTDPSVLQMLTQGSPRERQAVQKFIAIFSVYSEDNIRQHVRDLYADDAYFRDPFREARGVDEIELYFLSLTEGAQELTFEVDDVAVHNGNYYFRWIMHLTLKRNPQKEIDGIGISHVRFNSEGKVVFQQDYWDSAMIYREFPVIGPLIRWIEKRL